AHPRIRRPLVREQDLERLVDPDHVRDPLQHVARERRGAISLPLEIRRPRGRAEEADLFVDAESPQLRYAEEGAQPRLRHLLSWHRLYPGQCCRSMSSR